LEKETGVEEVEEVEEKPAETVGHEVSPKTARMPVLKEGALADSNANSLARLLVLLEY